MRSVALEVYWQYFSCHCVCEVVHVKFDYCMNLNLLLESAMGISLILLWITRDWGLSLNLLQISCDWVLSLNLWIPHDWGLSMIVDSPWCITFNS